MKAFDMLIKKPTICNMNQKWINPKNTFIVF